MCSMCARSRVYWSIKIKAYTYRCENEQERARNTRTRFKFHCICIVQMLALWFNANDTSEKKSYYALAFGIVVVVSFDSFVLDQFSRSKCDQMCEHTEYQTTSHRIQIAFLDRIAYLLSLTRFRPLAFWSIICLDDISSFWEK